MDKEYVKDQFGEVLINVYVELGRKLVSIGDMLSWDSGTIIKLNKTSGESVDFIVNNKPLANGEIMVLDDKFGIRITDIMSKTAISEMKKDGLYD
jgi:flagellar motor switch protein FliN/FliY